MTRSISASFATGLEASTVQPLTLVELLFDTGSVRLWSGLDNLTYGGNTYTGVGMLLGISSIEETADIAARGITISLSGISAQAISLALTEKYQNRTCNLYFALSGIVADAIKIFSGLIDQMSINDTGEQMTISLTVESRLIDLERARTSRYTSEDQKRLYPNDKGFDFVNDLQTKQILWGRK